MQIIGSKIILRDFIESDIEKRIKWETVMTEWQLYDESWKYERLSGEEKNNYLKKFKKEMEVWTHKFDGINGNLMRCSF